MHAFVYYKHIERLSCQCLGVFSRKKTFFRGIANMSLHENYVRRNCIPIIYTKGTHYEVGFDVVSIIIVSDFCGCIFKILVCPKDGVRVSSITPLPLEI